MSDENSEGLKRVIGVPGLAATIVNFTVGAAIYALPALIGIQLGAASVIGYLLCGIMFTAIILCYVEIGSRVKTSGGSYAYVTAAFGPFAGFITNWLFFFGWGIISDAAVMNIVGDSLARLYPSFADGPMRILLFAVLVGLMILVNVIDAKKSIRFVEFVTVIKLIPLIGIIIFGFAFVDVNNLRIEQMPSMKAFNDTALILFFALAGFETSLNVSGEIKDPKRTIPRGVLIGGLISFFIYVIIQVITIGIIGNQLNDYKDAPLAAIAEKLIGPTGGIILLIAAAISGFSSVNGDVLSSPRLLFAGANDGLFPKYLGKIHPRFSTPYLAVITYGSLIFVFSISGGFKQLAILACGALLLIYLAVVLALIKIRLKKEKSIEKSFKMPGGLTIPIIAVVTILYVLSNLSIQEITSIIIFVAVVCLIYFVMRYWKRQLIATKKE